MRLSPWKIGKYTRWASCWDQYSWMSAIPGNCHLWTEISKRRTIMQATVPFKIFSTLWTKLILLTHSACRAFHAFTDFLRRNKRTTSVYTWRCLSRLYYLTSHIFTSYKLWGKKKKAMYFYFLLLFYGMTFQQNNPCSLSQISLFFLLKFYNLDKIWHRSWRQIYCVALTKWLWQSDK